MTKEAKSPAALQVAIPEELCNRVASFLGEAMARDPQFWRIALTRGVDDLEKGFREEVADAEKEAADEGGFVIFGNATVMEVDEEPSTPPADNDDVPF